MTFRELRRQARKLYPHNRRFAAKWVLAKRYLVTNAIDIKPLINAR